MFFYELDRFSEDLDFDSTYPVSLSSLLNSLEEVGKVSVKKGILTVRPLGKDFSIKVKVSLRNYPPIDPALKIGGELALYGVNDLFL